MTLIVRADACSLDDLLARRELVIVIGKGELRGDAAAASLFGGWSVLVHDASLILDSPAAWAGAAWRLGDRAYKLWLAGTTSFDAEGALSAGLCDATVPSGRNADEWIKEWIGTRSELALDSAAALISCRGGDALERAEFARLFASGEPQIGLRAFLDKRTPRFS